MTEHRKKLKELLQHKAALDLAIADFERLESRRRRRITLAPKSQKRKAGNA